MEQYPDICAEIISIHALRVEGDRCADGVADQGCISIHALRVEGDFFNFFKKILIFYDFYPRPPGGGRPSCTLWAFRTSIFLSTPSGWRATARDLHARVRRPISIHALRVEGDLDKSVTLLRTFADFYPRPPGGGRPI